MRLVFFSLLIILHVIHPASVIAKGIEDVMKEIHQVWTDKEGLPQNSITNIEEDVRGWLWIGTMDGLAFYDGNRLQTLHLPSRTISNAVPRNNLQCARDGSIWIGTRAGWLHKLLPELGKKPSDWQWQSYKLDFQGQKVRLHALLCLSKGEILIGTNFGLLRFDRTQEPYLSAVSGIAKDSLVHPVFSILESQNGTLYAGTKNGVYVINDSIVSLAAFPGGINSKPTSLLETQSKQILVGSEGNGLFQLSGDRLTARNYPELNWQAYITAISQDENGILFISTNRGLFKQSAGQTTWYSEQHGLSNQVILSLLSHDSGQLFIGTEVGLSVLRNGSFKSIGKSEGIHHPVVWSIAEAPESGKFFFGTTTGLSIYDPRTNRFNKVLYSLTIRDILPIRRNGVLLATNQGLYHYENQHTKKVLPDLFEETTFTSLLKLPNNQLYMATAGNGLFITDPFYKSVRKLNTKNGLPSNYIYCALPLNQNKIYLGTRAGLVLLKSDQTEVTNTENGLINNEVRSLIQDSTGGLWIGTSGGLSYRKDGRWMHFDEESSPALPNNVVYQLQLDQSGRIYGLTNRGVFRLTPTSSNSDTLSVRMETFTTEDGLPSMEGNAGASFRDSRGRIWFGTTEGAAMISPHIDPKLPKQPKTLLNAVLFKNELRDHQHQKMNHFNRDSSLTLDHEQNEITFKFACLNFKRESETRFRTQLVGFDQYPSDWQSEGQKAYTNLPAGDYEFVAEAMDYAGKMAKPATFSFSIQPSPWQTPIAYAGYVLLAGILLYSLHQLNILRLKKRQQELEYLVDVRTREVASQKRALEKNNQELTELNDLKTQFLSIASHDLKNPLQNILGYAQLIREEAHKDGTISPMAESIHRASQYMLGLIKELLDTSALESGKLELNKTSLDLGALISIVCDDYDMRVKKKQQILEYHTEKKCLVHADAHRLREVMENLLSNAIKYSPNNTKITINVYPDKRENQSVVVCKVTDQGLGLSTEDMTLLFGKFKKLSARPTAGESSTGLGLSIVKHLVELHNGRIWAESPGKNCGSTFFIELPASQSDT